ncbi:helix-turn-helix transcriptional regulator [Thalassococcus sp. CAU 1522]|uniref:Helix-turn-helix transcriptional regulator n=2 Tax=Thalassococcus arenae TaxID=2851652 RepID=A0ABS6N9Z1_9RHOB|nr:helix-turn-helix transcriptional regulator [Thalassococcus arenae]
MQPAPWRFTLAHDRPTNLLIWFTRGQGRVMVNGLRRGVSAHAALYLPAGTLFALDPGPQAQALMVESPAGLTGRLPREPLLLRVRDGLAQAELTGTIDAMTRELAQNRPLMADALEAHIRLIAVWLHRQVAAGALDAPKPDAAQRLARRFARLVVQDFRTPRVMADYAAALDVTPTHLTRVLRRASGRTAADLLTDRKLHEARRLLALPAPPVKDVAAMLGFQSAAYFTRFIRNHTAHSPSALRKRAQTGPAKAT